MKIGVVVDGHYYRLPNGDVYTDSVYEYKFFNRYLRVFRNIYVVARIEEVFEVDERFKKSSGLGIEFIKLTDFYGIKGYIRNIKTVKTEVSKSINQLDGLILRMPSAISYSFVNKLIKRKKPFAIEVVADPWALFSRGASTGGLARIPIRYYWTYMLKKACNNASGISYVTEKYLQKRYKSTKSKNFTSSYLCSFIENEDFHEKQQRTKGSNDLWKIVHVANSIDNGAKGHMTVIKSVELLIKYGYKIEVSFIGDGKLVSKYKDSIDNIGLGSSFAFIGRIYGSKNVMNEVRKHDLLVLPSKSEGLPRSIIEAMVNGIPCIGSDVGGISELIEKDYLISDYRDYRSLADKIEKLICNKEEYKRLSIIGLDIARKYSEEETYKRTDIFYGEFRDLLKAKYHK